MVAVEAGLLGTSVGFVSVLAVGVEPFSIESSNSHATAPHKVKTQTAKSVNFNFDFNFGTPVDVVHMTDQFSFTVSRFVM